MTASETSKARRHRSATFHWRLVQDHRTNLGSAKILRYEMVQTVLGGRR
jgi:hypothetical protein